jgi:hypothetical protein
MEDIRNRVFSYFFSNFNKYKESSMENAIEEVEKKESFATKMGQFVANMTVACVAVCLSAFVIALTLRFIIWLF